MNRIPFSRIAAVAVCLASLGAAAHLRSQEQAEVTANPLTVTERLAALKAANAALLEKQTQTLQKLDDLKQTADQLRIYTKRS